MLALLAAVLFLLYAIKIGDPVIMLGLGLMLLALHLIVAIPLKVGRR